MAVVVRILDLNLLPAAVLSADSFYQSLPPAFLRDQTRSKPWRSSLAWVVVTGWNDKIDFNRGGVKVATVAAGTYGSGAELAVAIVTALEAADTAPVWECDYNGIFPYKFVILSDFGNAFVLLFGTGANLATSIGPDLGFAIADTASDVVAVAGNASHQSRHWLGVDLGSAQAITAAIVLDNVSAGGTVKLLSSATSVLAALTAPAATQTLTDRGTARAAYFGSQSHRYLAFVIDDIGNSDGFAEVGIAYAGTYRQPSVSYSVNFSEDGDDLSETVQGPEGALYGDLRPEAPAWRLEWLNIPEADADIFRAHRTATPKGKSFFLDFDAAGNAGMVYGYRDGPLPLDTPSGGLYWRASFTFREALP